MGHKTEVISRCMEKHTRSPIALSWGFKGCRYGVQGHCKGLLRPRQNIEQAVHGQPLLRCGIMDNPYFRSGGTLRTARTSEHRAGNVGVVAWPCMRGQSGA